MRAFAERSAALLSGGQQQRVALARAIAFSPDVLLFDEPLSNLDAKLRAEMRVELRALQHRLGVTSLYVTHDQEEALAISDRVIVMNVGGIEQIGTPEDIYNRPKTRFVADFVGSANLIAGRVGPGTSERASGPGPVDFDAAGGVRLRAWASHAPRGGESHVAVRTAYIDMAPGEHRRIGQRRNGGGQLRAGNDPPASVPRRFHPVHRRLAVRRADRAPSADRDVRRRRGGDAVLRAGTLHPARGVTVRSPGPTIGR